MFSTYKRATVIIVIMTQPLGDGIPPMRICSFGSDNSFTATDVKNRLDTIVSLLKEKGISVLTYSTDGDSRIIINYHELNVILLLTNRFIFIFQE